MWSSLVTDDRLPDGLGGTDHYVHRADQQLDPKLFQIAGDAQAAGGVVKRAASYVPVSTQTLGPPAPASTAGSSPSILRRGGNNVRLLRDWGVLFQDGALDEQYLVSVVDEAHALINPEHSEGRGQFGFAPTFGPIAWHIMRCSTVSIFLLDSEQGFRDRENTTLDRHPALGSGDWARKSPSRYLAGGRAVSLRRI
jgi:hypothetical protein